MAVQEQTAARARQAVAWATGYQLGRDVLQFGLTVTLARLLPAEAYGQFGLLTAILGFFTLYSFREFLGHTLQLRDGEAVPYQDHFTAGAVIQSILFVVVNLVAVGLRVVPAYAPLAPVLHVMAVLFLLDLPSEFRVRMLERQLAWRRLRLLQAVAFVAGGVASIALAAAGARVSALILPTLLAPLPFVYDLFVVERWRPTWAFSWARFHPAWSFGWLRLGAASLVAIATLGESSWLTAAIGFAALGIFGRAVGVAQLLCGRVASLVSLSLYPVLTRLPPASDAFRRASALYLRAIAWLVVPLAAMAAIVADPLIVTVYGRAWAPAIPLVPAAVAAAALGALGQTGYTLLLACGRQRQCLLADACKLVGTVTALAAALPHGPRAYLAALGVVQALSFGLIAVMLVRAAAADRTALALAVVPAAVATAAAWGIARPLMASWPVAAAAAFGLVYLLVLRAAFARPFEECVTQLPQGARLRRWLRLSAVAAA